jgi:phosphatidylserine decarboxylase
MHIPVAREGYPFILAALIITALIWFISVGWLFSVSILAAVFVVSFFRDPERNIPRDPDSIVSPADGKVIKVERIRDDRFLKDEALKVSIFMNVFNVHVNRAPVSGRVATIIYNPGRFFSANLDKASLENEQNSLFVDGARGRLVLNQIAGLVARRIVCRVSEGAELTKGERIGIIRFGSRVDVYMPIDSRVTVKVGDRVKAGSSVLGYW